MPPLLDPTSNEQKYGKLSSAAIIGAITAKSVRLWIRVYQPGNWTLAVTTLPLSGDLMRLDEKTVLQFLTAQPTTVIYRGTHAFTQDTNLTHVFDVTGLAPGRRYYYALLAEERDPAVVSRRTEIGIDAPKCFQTIPPDAEPLVFAFYSCHDHISANGDVGAWPHLLEQMQDANAHFSIGGGDQIYVDTNGRNNFLDIWVWLKDNKADLLAQFSLGKKGYDTAGIEQYLLNIYRWYYRVYWSVPPLRAVFEQFPQYMMWDDHEIMDGWGSLTNDERLARISRLFEDKNTAANQMLVDLMWKAACRAYFEYEHSHNPDTGVNDAQLANPDTCQWDYAFAQGSAAFYMLDMRGHHDVEKNVGKAKKDNYLILGKAQFSRFSAWLTASVKAGVKTLFVVSPVPVVHWNDTLVNYADWGGSKDDFMDEWGHESNWWERDQLLSTLYTALGTSDTKLVFLSGDVHCASAFQLRHAKYPQARVFQITSSAISRKPAPSLSMLGIAPTGPMHGNAEVYCERLYAMAGSKNFAMVRVQDAGARVIVDLHWPEGNEGAVTKKRLELK